jgi:transcriptional regulator with XRE-family HTH domain
MKNARIRLGQEILRRRKAMGMTQEELASRMGVSRQSVAKWETGLSSPDIDRLALLRDVLQTSLDELIAPAGRELIPEPVPPAEDSVRPEPAGPVRNLRLLPLILGTLLFCCGLGGLAALWVLSRLHPVRLVDWDGSLHTGLEGYLMAAGLWPVLLLACILLGFICGARAEKTADLGRLCQQGCACPSSCATMATHCDACLGAPASCALW